MNWKTTLGWLLLGLSLCCTAIVFSLPFSSFSLQTKAVGIGAAMIVGKGLFAASVVILGRPVIGRLKSRIRFWFRK
ncbi:MAG: transporter suffix domain-containing protein [Saprospiraceae bacterium]